MQDMQDVTQEMHYENYRSERLVKGVPVPKRTTYVPFSSKCFRFFAHARSNLLHYSSSLPDHEKQNGTADPISERDRMLQEKEAELKRMQAELEKIQAQIKQKSS